MILLLVLVTSTCVSGQRGVSGGPKILPVLRRGLGRVVLRVLGVFPRQVVFTTIYRRQWWGQGDSRSGSGSDLAQTEAIRAALPRVLREVGCHTLLDIPCGDFHWMRTVALDVDYIGGDIVPDLVEANQRAHGGARRSFIHLDLVSDPLPRADVILVRDCLVHLSFRDVRRALLNIKQSGCSYLLTTTFTNLQENEDTHTGGHRLLNLERAPFMFPPPLQLIPERPGTSKSLGLWRIADLPHPD